MSLLNPEEEKIALSQGWNLFHVYDGGVWSIKALSTHPNVRNAEAASQCLIGYARTGSVLHRKAIQIIMASQQGR